jgi:hypothetical protein
MKEGSRAIRPWGESGKMRSNRTRATVPESAAVFPPPSNEWQPTSLELLSECQAEASAMRELQAQLNTLLIEIRRERNAWRETARGSHNLAA